MSTISETLSAGQRRQFAMQADFLRVLTGNSVKLTFFRNGQIIQESSGVSAGYSIRLDKPFDRFDIEDLSAASNAFSVLLGSGVDIEINSVTGSVSVAGTVEVSNDAGSPLPVASRNSVGGSCVSSAALLAAGATEAVIVANPNGCVLEMADFSCAYAAAPSGHSFALVAKSGGAPANLTDGVILALGRAASGAVFVGGIGGPIYLPAGWLVSWVNAAAAPLTASSRSVRWTAL